MVTDIINQGLKDLRNAKAAMQNSLQMMDSLGGVSRRTISSRRFPFAWAVFHWVK
jgi:hypothetical protein